MQPNVHCRFHKNPSLDPTFCQFSTFPRFTSCTIKIRFNIIPINAYISQVVSFFQVLRSNLCMHFPYLPCVLHVIVHLILPQATAFDVQRKV
jgi:hypothetical protein